MGNIGDVYYLQLVNKVRKFKGMSKQDTTSAEKSINIGTLDNWDGVKPEFRHYLGNNIHRNHKGHGDSIVYTNTSGRNDIVLAKVARDQEFIYFYVETADSLSPASDSNWMRLFIDMDRDQSTGWEGYDFLLNRESPVDSVTIEKSIDRWNWTRAGSAAWYADGNAMEWQVNRSIFGVEADAELNFEFKWSDNMIEDGNIMDFYVNGDVAPGGRFNFVYSTDPTVSITELKTRPYVSTLSQNYPNPFNKTTSIEFSLPASMHARLTVFNMMGQKIRSLMDETGMQGLNRVEWDACNESGARVDPGLYFYRLETESGEIQTRSLVLF